MGLKWRSLLFYAGIVLLIQTACTDAARVPKASARLLAEKTGAAHYEERSSEEGQEHQLRKRASDEDFDYEVYQGVVGRPGIDFPILPRIPQTTFSCRTFGNGYFADLETECQVFHICDDGRKISFLCPNGTIFQQSELICDWWFKVNCPASPGHYAESAEMLNRAQGRKRPSYTKKVENEFHTNGNGYSRAPFSDKSQYPIKKDNRRFEDSPDRVSQGKKKGNRFDSEEIPSLENFDFEDISDNRQSGKLKTSKPDDGEMQDVAETASFVGNGQRRNGYNYDTLHEGQKPYDDRKGYDRSKPGRGRQKYRGDATKPPRGRSQNLGDGAEENTFTTRERGTTTRGGVTNKFEEVSRTTPGLIHQRRPVSPTTSPQTTRDKNGSHTTPRRLDNSRTTPYYTPTVPTIRATQTPVAQKTESGVFPTTTGVPSGTFDSKDSPTGSAGNLISVGDVDHSQRIPGDGRTGVTGSFSISGSGQPKIGAGITSTFAVSGPPAVTIPPHDHSFESQKTGPSATTFGTQGLPPGTISTPDRSFESQKTSSFGTPGPIQDSTGYSYQTPSKSSKNLFLNSAPSPLRPSQSITSGTTNVGLSGTPQDTSSSRNGPATFGTKPGSDLTSGAQAGISPTLSQRGSGNDDGYSYKTPSKQSESASKSGAGVKTQSTQGRSDPFNKNAVEKSTAPHGGLQKGPGTDSSQRAGVQGGSPSLPDISGQTTIAPSLSQSKEGVSSDANQAGLPTLSGRAQGNVGGVGSTTPSSSQKEGVSGGTDQSGLPSITVTGGAQGNIGDVSSIAPSLSQGVGVSGGTIQAGLPSLSGPGATQGNVGGVGPSLGSGSPLGGSLTTTGRSGDQGSGGTFGTTGKDGNQIPSIGQEVGARPDGSPIGTGKNGIGSTFGFPSNGKVSSTSPTITASGSIQGSKAGDGKPEGGALFTGGISSATPTPLVIGMRGTIPTDPTHKGTDSSAPLIAVNVLSDGTFSGKGSIPSPVNSLHGSFSDGSSVKPTTFKPFTSTYLNAGSTLNGQGIFSGSTYLPKDATTIRPSSSGPTYLPKPTKPSNLPESVSEHVDEMIKSLSELKDGISSPKSRIGLEIPPSSGPETLHSLALYFAGEGDNASTTTETGEPTATIKADINAVPLSNKTVHQYEALFGLGTTTTDKSADTTLPPNFQPNLSRSGVDLEAQHSSNPLAGAGGKGETRKIAQVFTNALSAYLEDPDSFRKVLTEVRPTEPPSTEENEVTTQTRTTNAYFNKGTAASYLPTAPTTVLPQTTTEDLEVLDFSDVTISTGQKAQTPLPDSATEATTSGSPGLKGGLDRISASSLAAARREKQGKNLRTGDDSSSNQIAVEINKGLGLSTAVPYILEGSGKTGVPRGSFGLGTSTTSSPEGTTTNLPLTFDLLPPVSGGKSSNLGAPSSDILPPGYDDDEDTLQRAQSQSFVAPRNRLGDAGRSGKGSKSGTKVPGHYITRLMSDNPTTTDYPEGVSPWFLDPLTINDGLMDEFRTTTASPYTYLPKVTSSTTETSPVHLDLTSTLNRIQSTDSKADRLGKALPGIPDDLLPPENGMQRIANKVFGSLNASSADHLMNVMKKAEDNPTVRRLILLLIQTCGDDDYSKTVEQSRQVLLNALIGMDEKLGLEDEIEVIKLRPKQNRRGKSIGASDKNSIISSTTEYPVTTFRRDISAYTASTENPGSTTISPLDDTTRFEIRVEDPDEQSSTTTSEPDILNLSTTTNRPGQETTSSYSTSDSSISTISPLNSGEVLRVGSRRTAKDVEASLSQPSLSHKSSDERALELLKSLYSLASKFGRR